MNRNDTRLDHNGQAWCYNWDFFQSKETVREFFHSLVKNSLIILFVEWKQFFFEKKL